MSGHYRMQRGWQDHPIFGSDPYSRRDAWEWLIGEAAWRETVVGHGGKMLTLARGQLSHSVRFMAAKWKWSKSAVDRFLTRLETGTMIETATGTGQIVITIINYGTYQATGTASGTDSGTQTGTGAGQQRDKEEEPKNLRKISSKSKRAKKEPIFFVEDQGMPPEFAKVAARYPQYDAADQWASCRDWHLKTGTGTASIAASANTWLKRAGTFQTAPAHAKQSYGSKPQEVLRTPDSPSIPSIPESERVKPEDAARMFAEMRRNLSSVDDKTRSLKYAGVKR